LIKYALSNCVGGEGASVVGFAEIRILKYTSFVPGRIFLNRNCQAEVLILMKS
jgi:hypothetical protein